VSLGQTPSKNLEMLNKREVKKRIPLELAKVPDNERYEFTVTPSNIGSLGLGNKRY
jgi:hypothetical protein